MNKKIYYLNKFLALHAPGSQYPQNQQIKILDFKGLKKDELKKTLNGFLDASNNDSLLLMNAGEEAFEWLKAQFYYIEAAGGLIEKNASFLCIHRHGRWDLPKGKLEKKETVEHAAVRECEEECGISRLQIIKALPSTFHVYAYKDGFALKQSYWFYMRSDFDGTLSPQLEEDIDQVAWFTRDELLKQVLPDTYFTISDVLKQALNL